ncbi:hypothetical protein [Streptomyces sp. NPDC053431]
MPANGTAAAPARPWAAAGHSAKKRDTIERAINKLKQSLGAFGW